jgi:effector-binding domain-containing protein
MTTYDIHAETRTEQQTAVCRATLPVSEIGEWIGRAYRDIAAVLGKRGAEMVGPPFARYHRVGEDRFEVEAGAPLDGRIDAEGEVRPSSLPGGQVAVTTYVGPYDGMRPAYDALDAWVREHGGKPVGDPWEVYLSDPGREPDPATWRTEIVQPYRAG